MLNSAITEVQTIRRRNSYVSRRWNFEDSARFVVSVADLILETSHFKHFSENVYVKDVIELPTSYGCAIRCRHCASALIEKPKLLTVEQIVDLCVWTVDRAALASNDNFLVTFSGIGEGALSGFRVFEAASQIYRIYPNATFTFTTVGVDPSFVEQADVIALSLPTRYLQISFLHHIESMLEVVIPSASKFKYSFPQLLKAVAETKNITVRFNIVVVEGLNTDPLIWDQWVHLFGCVRERVSFRISALNETSATTKYGLQPAKHSVCEMLVRKLRNAQYDAYFFASMENDNLNCGQLVWNHYRRGETERKN
jgi:adenine C2-methylase RlmN of 23S rRNA A2503 and tRNA A37